MKIKIEPTIGNLVLGILIISSIINQIAFYFSDYQMINETGNVETGWAILTLMIYIIYGFGAFIILMKILMENWNKKIKL